MQLMTRSRRTTMLALLLTACVVGAALAAPQPAPAPDATRPLDEGKSLYEQARFTLAVAKLQEAIGVLEREPDRARRRAALADAFLHLGLAFIGLNEREAARDAFKNVLRLDPDYRPDAELYAPKVIELFEQARLGLPVSAAAQTPDSESAAPRPRGKPRLALGVSTTFASFSDADVRAVTIPGVRYPVNEAWLPAPDGVVLGALVGIQLANGKDRIELAAQIVDHAERYQNEYASVEVATDNAYQQITGTRSREFRINTTYTLEARWLRRIAESRWWTVHSELSYRALSGSIESWDWLRTGDNYSADALQFGESRRSSVSSHGIRAGASVRRAILGPLALEIAAGYTLHVARDDRECTYSSPQAPTTWSTPAQSLGAQTQVQTNLDLALRAHLPLKDRAALIVGYSWRPMGHYYAGRLHQSGFTVSLMLGPSR